MNWDLPIYMDKKPIYYLYRNYIYYIVHNLYTCNHEHLFIE